MELDLEKPLFTASSPNAALAACEAKYFGPSPLRRKVITRQYLTRSAAKKARQTHSEAAFPGRISRPLLGAHHDYFEQNGLSQAVDFPAPYDRPSVLITGARVDADIRFSDYSRPEPGSLAQRKRRGWSDEIEEGRGLARSQIPLPYSGEGPIRRPTLEREEAFVDPTTCKKRRNQSMKDSMVSVVSDDVDPDVAQLYQMGLLYDDDYSRGSGFNLNTIVHNEPAYTLRFAKPSRKAQKLDSHWSRLDLPQTGLPLDLSFAQLHEDERLAKFLISPSPSETSADWEASVSTSEAIASVHSLKTSYEEDTPVSTQDTQMSDAVPDLMHDCPEPQTTQTPDFDCDSDTTSCSGSDADLVILPLHMLAEESEATRRRQHPRHRNIPTFDDATASWIVLGDDS